MKGCCHMAMTIEKLIVAVQKTVVTDEDVQELNNLITDAETRFEDEIMKKESNPQGFLNFQYTL